MLKTSDSSLEECKKKENKKQRTKRKQNNKMANLSLNMSITVLNVNCLNIPLQDKGW